MKGVKSQLLMRAVAVTAFAIVATGSVYAASTSDSAPSVDSVPEKTAPGTKPNENLSQKLDQSNGVIQPQNVDPKMDKPVTTTGSGDVIKPLGTTGGPPGPTPK